MPFKSGREATSVVDAALRARFFSGAATRFTRAEDGAFLAIFVLGSEARSLGLSAAVLAGDDASAAACLTILS